MRSAVPMQVVKSHGPVAICRDRCGDGGREQVDLGLVGAQPRGTRVLVLLGADGEPQLPAHLRAPAPMPGGGVAGDPTTTPKQDVPEEPVP